MSPGQPGSTRVYVEGRERVLGERLWLSDDPRLAAVQLADRVGARRARRWLAEALRALERTRRAA